MNEASGAASPGRRERKKREVFGRIRQAALELFQEKGYEATTVEEIADRADVAKGTFFNYFPRKDALLSCLAEDMLELLHTELGPQETWGGTSQDQLRLLFVRLAEIAERDPELSRVVLFENMRNLWLRSTEDVAIQELRGLIRAILTEGRVRGELRLDAEIETAATLMESAYFTTLVDWLSTDTSVHGFQRALASKLDIVFRGLAANGEAREGT
jgi:TetR/AcrR family transcriptional regulator, cholesterol catabolism regulator